MKKFFTLGITASLLLIATASIYAQDTRNPWHLIALENEKEVSFYNIEVITGIEATGQSVKIVLDKGKEFSHPFATTTFGFEPRQKGTGTANKGITVPQCTVHYANGRLHFSETVNGIAIYTIFGALVAQFAGNHTEVPVRLTSGIFIVYAGGKSARLLIGNSNGSTITQTEVITKSSVYTPAPINLRTYDAIKVYWNIKANSSTSVEIPNVDWFYFMADNTIVFTMKNGDTKEITGYHGGEFAIEPVQPEVDTLYAPTDEFIKLAYDMNYIYPVGFYLEKDLIGSTYYENTVSVNRMPPWIEFHTTSKDEARNWSNISNENSSVNRKIIQENETEKYFEFVRVNIVNENDVLFSRVHHSDYFIPYDEFKFWWSFDKLIDNKIIGTYNGEVTINKVKEFVEYLWVRGIWNIDNKVIESKIYEKKISLNIIFNQF